MAGNVDAMLPLLEAEIAYWDQTGLADVASLARDNLGQVRAVRAAALAAGADEAAAALAAGRGRLLRVPRCAPRAVGQCACSWPWSRPVKTRESRELT